MSIELLTDEAIDNFVCWALETGLWDGRPVDWKEAPRFFSELETRLHHLVFSNDSDTFAFEKLAATFAWVGSFNGEKTDLVDKIEELKLISNGTVIAARHKHKSFWEKHKTAIIVGIVVVAIITTIVVVTVCTGGTGGGAAVAAGGAALNELQDFLENTPVKKMSPSASTPGSKPISEPKPLSLEPFEQEKQLSQSLPTYPFNSLTYSPPVVSQNKEPEVPSTNFPWVSEGMSYLNWREQQTREEFFQSFLNKKDPPKPVPLSENAPVNSFAPASLPQTNFALERDIKPPPKEREIPVFSSTNYPPVTEKFAWVCKMIDWGLTDDGLGATPPIPVLENATSQVFRTIGEQRKDVKILGINGINTSLHESIQHAEYLTQFTNGLSVTWIHNHSNGSLVDIGECIALNFAGTSPNTKTLERDEWIAFHEKNRDNPRAKCLHYCHSQGAIATKNALESVPEEIQKRVIVVAVAPAAVIPSKLCYESYNYASKQDKVYLAEMLCKSAGNLDLGKQALEDFEQLILLEPHEGATGLDHDFESPTFSQKIADHLNTYLQPQGTN